MAGYADEIDVTVHADDSVTVVDNGRGIPVDMHATEKHPAAAEVVLTVLHAGGKFDSDIKVSGGLHGVGVSVVNALSDRLELEISRDGAVWEQYYEKGKPTTKLKQTGKTRKTGTSVTFHPDPTIFDKTVFSFDTLSQRLRELAFLNKGVHMTSRMHSEKTASFALLAASPVRQISQPRQDHVARFTGLRRGQLGTEEIEIALQCTDTYGETVFTFANTINTIMAAHTSPVFALPSHARLTISPVSGRVEGQKDEDHHRRRYSGGARRGVSVAYPRLPSLRGRPRTNSQQRH